MQDLVRFGVFELHLRHQELRKAGTLIRLRPQAFKLLVLLTRHAGELLSRERIRKELWSSDTTVDFEQGVNRCVKELRVALGDDAEPPRYIKTVHRGGYLFVAPVHGNGHPAETKRPYQEFQLTTHSHEASITLAAISPDGRYLAYADASGMYVELIESGETHAFRDVEASQICWISWFPDSTKLAVSGQGRQTSPPAIWVLSIFGSVLWKLSVPAAEAVPFLDGSGLVFIDTSGKDVWLVKSGGEDQRRIFSGEEADRIAHLAWLSEGQKLLFRRVRVGLYRFDVTIECLDLTSGRVTTVLSDSRLRGSSVSPEGRLVYALADTAPRQSDVNLWEIQMDPYTAELVGKPLRITHWTGCNLYGLSMSRDATRLAFLKGPYQANVYVGELVGEGTELKNVRRLTLDERNHLPTAWTSDSKSVLFHSDRNGKWEIFRQGLDDRTAAAFITGTHDCRGARISPDGSSVFYFARPRDRMWSWSEPLTLMRIPYAGGVPSIVSSERRPYSVRCARQENLCILGERKLTGQFAFYALDAAGSKGRQLAKTKVEIPLDQNHWDISPDGAHIAILVSGGPPGKVRILSVPDGATRDFIVPDWGGLQSMDWAANGQGLYVSSQSATHVSLLFIDLRGHAWVLRQQPGRFQTWGVPSPDGHYLAFLEWTSASNVWMIEHF